jgi:hypothetical protein
VPDFSALGNKLTCTYSLYHGTVGQSPASNCRDPGAIPGQFVWGLNLIKWHFISPSISRFPYRHHSSNAPYHFRNVSSHSSAAALKTEAANFTDVFVTTYQTTRLHTPKEWNFKTCHTHLWLRFHSYILAVWSSTDWIMFTVCCPTVLALVGRVAQKV